MNDVRAWLGREDVGARSSFETFCRFSLSDTTPNDLIISKFRKGELNNNLHMALLEVVNAQLAEALGSIKSEGWQGVLWMRLKFTRCGPKAYIKNERDSLPKKSGLSTSLRDKTIGD